MFWRQVVTIMKKEFIHIRRDPQALFLVFVWPVFLLVFFGYAFTLELRNITTIVQDYSHTPASRQLIEKLAANRFFKVSMMTVPESHWPLLFQQRKAQCIVVIPSAFADDLGHRQAVSVQLLIDAADANAALSVQNYVSQVVQQFQTQQADFKAPVQIETRFFYNPELKSTYFFVPGLAAVLMMLMSALLTSIAIVREKERGTMEPILVSPLMASGFVVGKVIPYVVISFLCGLGIIGVAAFWFAVPIMGSIWLLMLMMGVYVFCGASLGLFVSAIVKTQYVAQMITMLLTLLPTILLSGFIFPLESMPKIFQWLSNIIPATHFIQIMRGVMLKGDGVLGLYDHIVALVAIMIVLCVSSIKKLHSTLE